MSKSWEAKSSRWSQRLQRAEEWPGLLKARCKYPVVISIKRGILCKVCVYIPKYSALSPCCFTVFRLLIHQCPPGGLPETPRASAAPVSTWILLGKHPAWEGILSLLLIKPGGSWQEMPPGVPLSSLMDLQGWEIRLVSRAAAWITKIWGFVMRNKILWRRNPALLQQQHPLFL